MTQEEAQRLIADLTEEQKLILFRMLSSLTQSQERAALDSAKEM